jgi:hypothetical protein
MTNETVVLNVHFLCYRPCHFAHRCQASSGQFWPFEFNVYKAASRIDGNLRRVFPSEEQWYDKHVSRFIYSSVAQWQSIRLLTGGL